MKAETMHVDDDYEDEDRVQLVGSNTPVSRVPTPTPAQTVSEAISEQYESDEEAAEEAKLSLQHESSPELQRIEKPGAGVSAPTAARFAKILPPQSSALATPSPPASAHSTPETEFKKASANEHILLTPTLEILKQLHQVEDDVNETQPTPTGIGISIPIGAQTSTILIQDKPVAALDAHPPSAGDAEVITTNAEQDLEMGGVDDIGGNVTSAAPKPADVTTLENVSTEAIHCEEKRLGNVSSALKPDTWSPESRPLPNSVLPQKITDKNIRDVAPPTPSPITPVPDTPVAAPASADVTVRVDVLDTRDPSMVSAPSITAPVSSANSTPRQPVIGEPFDILTPKLEVNFKDAISEDVIEPAAALPTPDIQSSCHALKRKAPAHGPLTKVVISSAHHAAAQAEAEARRIREDQESQGMIVVARRREQQAAAVAARARSSNFQSGSKLDLTTRFMLAEPSTKEEKRPEIFEALYTIKSYNRTADELLHGASKTVSTSNYAVRYFDSQTTRILNRVQQLQSERKWGLMQIAKVLEPKRKKVHHDYMLDEMKWLREDFREERKWKITVARQMALAVREWHDQPERRQELKVDRCRMGRVPKGLRENTTRNEAVGMSADTSGNMDISMGEAAPLSQPTPDLMEAGGTPEDEGSEDYFVKQEGTDDVIALPDGMELYYDSPPPAGVFALPLDETVYAIAPTKAAADVLEQLPLFAPPKPPSPGTLEDANDEWVRPIIPVTRYTQGRLVLDQEEEGPPRKKPRYEFDINHQNFADDSDEEGEIINDQEVDVYGRPHSRDKTSKPIPLPPEQTDVALFQPQFKPTLARVRSRPFKAPGDLPPLPFLEARSPSLWTQAEDDNLRLLAKEFHHNWSLISAYLQPEGMWHSGSERRSAWECFERYAQIEEIPQDFYKAPLARLVQTRLDVASRVGGHYAPGSAGSQGANQMVQKRRGTQPIQVQKRRTSRTTTIFEGMRKLAKKRESQVQKQQNGRGGGLT